MLADRVRRAVERQAADLVDYLLEYVPCVRAQFLQKTVLDAPTVVRLAQLLVRPLAVPASSISMRILQAQ